MRKEEQTQIALCEFIALQYPEVAKYIIKIDNEGVRSVYGHAKAIKMGLHKGASDLFIAFPTLEYYGLFIEIKPDGWKGPSNTKEKLRVQKQLDFIEKMKKKGYYGELIVGVDQGINLIKKYLKQSTMD